MKAIIVDKYGVLPATKYDSTSDVLTVRCKADDTIEQAIQGLEKDRGASITGYAIYTMERIGSVKPRERH